MINRAFVLEQLQAEHLSVGLAGNLGYRVTVRNKHTLQVLATATDQTEGTAIEKAIQIAQQSAGVPDGPQTKEDELRKQVNELTAQVNSLKEMVHKMAGPKDTVAPPPAPEQPPAVAPKLKLRRKIPDKP